MNLQYIEFSGKHPKGYKNPEDGQAPRRYFDTPNDSWHSYGAKYPEGYLKIDIDDYGHKTEELVEPIHGAPRSKAVIAMLDAEKLGYMAIQTLHGVHLYMKVPDDLEHKTKVNWVSAVNIPMEWKYPESDDHMKLKVNGQMLNRFGCESLDDVDTLPKWLYPVQKSHEKPFSMHFEEGDRTNQLGGYVHHLVQTKGFTPDEAFQTVRLMNEFTFESTILDSTLNAEILNDETYAKLEEDYRDITKKGNKKVDSLDTFKAFLDSIGIRPRFNTMLHRIEWNNIPQDYDGLSDLENNMPIKIQDEYQKYIGHPVTLKTVRDHISYWGDKDRHEPVKEYLTSGTWDGKDRFPELYRIMGVNDSFQKILIKKWFYQAAAMPFNEVDKDKTDDEPNKDFQAEGVLILQGAEGIGKSRFFELISPSPSWKHSFYQDLDTNNKDKLLEVLSGFIVEIAEIDRTFRSNRSDIKGFLTASEDDIRRPYATQSVKTPRTTSYCGTTNELTFLTKDTGFRRWWVIPVTHIDLKALESLNYEEKHQFWLQCYQAWVQDKTCFRLTPEQQTRVKRENCSYMNLPPAAETLLDRFDFDAPEDTWTWKTSTEIKRDYHYMVYLESPKEIGVAMSTISGINPKIRRKVVHKSNRYFIPPAKTEPYDEEDLGEHLENLNDVMHQKSRKVR